MKKINILLIILLSILAVSCGKKKRKNMTSEESFDYAFKLYKKGKYEKAIQEFTIITLNFPGSNIADDSQFYLGECYFDTKQYLLAQSEYQRLVYDFPNSEFVDDAEYKTALSLYKMAPKNTSLDITDLERALAKFQEFFEAYPKSELIPEIESKIKECRYKLAKKTFNNAETYRKIGYYGSAVIYYNFVLQKYYDTEFADDAQYRKGYSYLKAKKYSDSKRELEIFIQNYPKSVFLEEAKKKLKEAEKNLAKQVLEEETKENS